MFCRLSNSTLFLASFSLTIVTTACGGGPTGETTFVAEGSTSSPTEVAFTSLPYSGQVDTTASYYTVTGAAAGATYTVSVSGQTNPVTLAAGDTSSFDNPLCTSASGGSEESCNAAADSSGNMYVQVDGTAGGNTGFTLNLSAAGTTTNEGQEGQPLLVDATSLPYSGQVAFDGDSYYYFNGLGQAIEYEITLSSLTADLDLNVQTSLFTSTTFDGCGSYTDGLVDESCTTKPDQTSSSSTGLRLYVKVSPRSFGSGNGGTFVLGMAYADHGSSTAPITYALSDLPAAEGQIGPGTSYYEITGYRPNGYYRFRMTALINSGFAADSSQELTMGLWDDTFTTQTCSNPRSCLGFANAAGELFGTVRYPGVDIGMTYTIPPLTPAYHIASEGVPTNEIVLPQSGLPHGGRVGGNSTVGTPSYYQVTGLVGGNNYRIRGTEYTEEIGLYVYSANDYLNGTLLCSDDINFNYGSVSCTVTSSPTTLYIKVQNPVINGTDVNLNVEDITVAPPFSGEGTTTSPVSITAGNLPYTSGEVDSGSSYYQITGLTADGFYLVTLGGLGANANLLVYNISGFGSYVCSSSNTGSADDSCTAPASASGELWVRVSGALAGTGTNLTLDAIADTNPFFAAEGSLAAPVSVTSLPHSGTVDATASYYRLSGLTGSASHRITLSATPAPVVMETYGDAFTTLDCADAKLSSTDAVCITEADSAGDIWVRVRGDTTTFGAAFTLDAVAYTGQPNEGTRASPVLITGTTTRSGSTVEAGGESDYLVSGLTPSITYTITLTALSGPVDLDVYWDGFPTTFKCGGYQLGTNDESCMTTPDADGNLYIIAAGGDVTGGGAAFTLGVQ